MMQIPPPLSPYAQTTTLIPGPSEGTVLPLRRNTASNPDTTQHAGNDLAASLSSIEQSFSGIIRSLSSALAQLEKQCRAALGRLFGSGASAAPDAPMRMSQGMRAVSPYDGLIRAAGKRHGVDPALVQAVVRTESGFSARAVSQAGAMGLMQLMPDTARSLGVQNAFDPAQNIDGGTRLLRSLLDKYHGRLELALAAYNAGPDAVDRYGGVPPFVETQHYVRDVMERYRAVALAS